ncbi:hypothetical protein Tco_0631569 [Tanacetum coccineum]
METHKPLLKDADGQDVDEHLYRSKIGSLMYLTSSRPDIMFAVCACARYQVNPKISHLHVVKRIFRYLKGQPKLGLWHPKDSPFDLCKKQTVVANSITKAEYVAASSYCGQVLWIQNQLLDYGDFNEKKLIQMIKIHTDQNIAYLLTKAFDLKKKSEKASEEEKVKNSWTQKVGLSAKVISSDDEGLGDQEDASKQGRKIADIDTDAEVTLIDETQGRNVNNLMFDISVLDEQEVKVEKVVSTVEVTTDSATTTTVDELTLAQTLIEIKAAKPKVRGVMIQKASEFTTTTPVASKPSQDKGKAKMTEPEKPLKNKDQIIQKEEETNIALIESWDNTQAMMDADYQMAQQLQAEEQEQLSIEEKSKLFVQLLEARKKHFAELRARKKRNKPPTQAQQRKLYCNYLKNMEGYTRK